MNWRRLTALTLVLTAWYTLPIAAPAYAETPEPPLLMLQVYRPVEARDPGVERVLEQAMAIALERQGPLSVSTAAFRDVGAEEALALNLAGSQGFSLLVIGAYQVVDDGLRLDARLLEVESRLLIAEVSVTREIDLRLDRIADAAAEALLNAAAPEISRMIAARFVEGPTLVPDEPPDETREPEEPVAGLPDETDDADVTGREPYEGPRYRIGAGLSLAIPVGWYAEFFGPGPAGEFSIHRMFARMRIGFSAGLLVSTPEQPETGEYARVFIPVLMEVGFPFAITGTITWEAHAAAGTAIRLAGDSPVSNRLAPALVAWRTRLAAIVPVSDRVSLVPHLTGMGAIQFYQGSPNGGDAQGVDHIIWIVPGIMTNFSW
ncbi:MAG: hypothetical protein EA403_05505 [Spirochaetaceae bacterium]|nr:MAG: hypothetical protein EA403_05505 [Spirochaetaceae bacterium]